MTYFKVALSAPAHHFRRLRLAEPLLCNGQPIIRRTHLAMESEIMLEGRHFLLFLPFDKASLHHIEELEIATRERSRGPLIENHILYDELTMFDSLGHRHTFDIILQELPSGTTLKEAIEHHRASDLRLAIQRMKERIDAIGFRHNNLTPSNVLICKSGVARPLRYWYAEWELYSNNDISALLNFIEPNANYNSESPCLVIQDCEAEYDTSPTKRNGIARLCRGGCYGFIDDDGHQIAPYIYSWASEFEEDRAVVAKGCKMGAIDSDGRKVIPVIYKSLKFDIKTGFFHASTDRYRYLIDYEGKIVSRTEIKENFSYEIGKEKF